MRPIDSRSVAFVPVSSSGGSSSTIPSTVYVNVNTNVLELVIPATSPDCPHPSLRQPEDGHFHTGDLFLQALPGHYTFRGRMSEWIKSSAGLLYDARYVCFFPLSHPQLSVKQSGALITRLRFSWCALNPSRVIEENTLKSFPDLLAECIVVGNGRPSPALLIELEPGAAALGDADSVRRELYKRIRHFQSRRLAHEKIASMELIVVVPRNAWPRTPVGLIRRVDVEQKFRRELDRAYAAASAR